MLWFIAIPILWFVVAGVGSGLECLIHGHRGEEFWETRVLWMLLCPFMLMLLIASALQLGIYKKLYWPWFRLNKDK